jgi:hypothetical protein
VVKTIALVACVKDKHNGPMPARYLYRSDLFKKSSTYAEKISDKWYILSAKYKLISPDEIISHYDLTLNNMSAEGRRVWSVEVYNQLISVLKSSDRVVILAGIKYRDYLIELLRQLGCDVEVPMAGLKIGEQLSWLKARLEQ